MNLNEINYLSVKQKCHGGWSSHPVATHDDWMTAVHNIFRPKPLRGLGERILPICQALYRGP